METSNHKDGKSAAVDALEQHGYSVQTEVDLPSTTDARVRVDVLGERDGESVGVEIGGVTDGKLGRMEPFVDRVVHVPYESSPQLTAIDSAVRDVFKRAVRDTLGGRKMKQELHRTMLDRLDEYPDEVVEHAVSTSDFGSVEELEAFVESGDPHILTAEYVRDAVGEELD